MKDFYKFIKQFLQNNGLNVFISIFLSKFTMLINTIFIVKMINQLVANGCTKQSTIQMAPLKDINPDL